jgi:hypothetical protein
LSLPRTDALGTATPIRRFPVRPSRPAAAVLAAVALALSLGACTDDAVAPEQGVDVGDATPPAPPTEPEADGG